MLRAIIFVALIVAVGAGAADVVTDANFDKLRVGMYRQQVTEILGWPDESEYDSSEGETVLVWTYRTESSKEAAETFRAGLSTGVTEEEIKEAIEAMEFITVAFKSGTYVDPASGYKRPNTLILIKAVMITPGREPKIRSIGKGYMDD